GSGGGRERGGAGGGASRPRAARPRVVPSARVHGANVAGDDTSAALRTVYDVQEMGAAAAPATIAFMALLTHPEDTLRAAAATALGLMEPFVCGTREPPIWSILSRATRRRFRV